MCQVCSQEAEWRGHKAKQSAQKSTNTHLRDHSQTTNLLLVLQRQLWRLKNWEAPSTRFSTLPSALALSQNNWKTILCLLLASFYRDRAVTPCKVSNAFTVTWLFLELVQTIQPSRKALHSYPLGFFFFFQDPGSFPWLTSLSPLKVLHRHF